ncbi:MAG: RagB/SusD family nutrient uptake outer membrane protein, partial [Bacteroidales bacterium]|nr:RagB/SusD family nutrient uptake outer membrane protein [Bacteroidales bacterium]
MKKLNIILLAVLGIFALASCDDFLDMQPTNQAESSEAIKTAADAQIMMNGIMSKMTSSSLYGRNITLYADAKGGDLTIYSAGRGNDALYSFNHSPSSGTYSGFWTVGYNIILQINNLLENIAKIESD